ncbi:amino acid/amide ABC transporter substrate-binding protein, HAAT family [Flavobacteriaceae bacterium MAR_2010_188]|nr:amino acid/amide ABC transporter substrate-binding protein, HAAT family [Flavobacteriaceae bacterium MAR_2010_188]
MKRLFIILCFSVCCALQVNAQQYITHEVKSGETIESIAKQYSVTPKDLLALNPDAKDGVKKYDIIVIPTAKMDKEAKEDLVSDTRELVGYTTHKTKRKETLYSISKEYNVSIDEIKKHNTFLYSSNLRKNDKIRIPKYKTVISTSPLNADTKSYTVLPKEGKWRVAYKFGLTVPELEALNPEMSEILQPGDKLNVPNIANNKEKVVEENYNYYTVLKSEGYMALERKLGLNKDALVKLNPGLEHDGLKLGMVLKIPKDIEVFEAPESVKTSNLASRITNFKPKKIGLMLPYSLHKIDVDSVSDAKRAIRDNMLLSVSLDFQSGVMIALDSAKQLGISTNLKVFDTRNHSTGVSKILSENNFEDYDAVIGPMMEVHFDRIANELKRFEVPAISPLTTPSNLYSNVYQTVPTKDVLEKTMIDFVKKDSTANIIIVSDSKHKPSSDRIKAAFPSAKQIFAKRDKEGKEQFYITIGSLENVFREGKKNIVFLESEHEGFISNVTSMVNGFNTADQEIILMTTDKNNGFEGESVSNLHLSKLKFHYPSVNRSFNTESQNSFVRTYKSIYGVVPNKYATRGFDLTMDVLLRLSVGESFYESSQNDIETEYVENKFRYGKKMFGGYVNESVYIVRYDDLAIVQVQ